MGKKKHKTQAQIRDQIYDDYIFNKEYESINDSLKQISLLVDNNLASRFTGKEDMAYASIPRYKVASKMLTKYDKELKKHKRDPLDFELGIDRVSYQDNPELIKLYKEGLDFGTYYVELGDDEHDDYALFIVSPGDPEDPYCITYDLYFIGYRHQKYKNKFLKMCDYYKKLKNEKKYEGIYNLADTSDYKETQFKSFKNMVFDGKDDILAYIDNWVESIPLYNKYEIVPKLSILLHGEPGTGKSTFARALAKYLGIENIGLVTADYFKSQDGNSGGNRRRQLNYLSMVYSLDDIDCICSSREENKSNENGKILSALLEFLDNPPTIDYKAKDGIYYKVSIVVASTNYFDRLDDAIKRYGRFDYKLKMKPLNYKQAEEMCALYGLKLRDVYHEEIKKDFTISPAYLQAICMENVDKALKKKGEEK